ncbi:MAG: hypothetical protein ABW213_15615 [Tardiphaga sp.]
MKFVGVASHPSVFDRMNINYAFETGALEADWRIAAGALFIRRQGN